MKATLLICGVVGVLLVPDAATACDKARKCHKPKPAPAAKMTGVVEEKTALTGSYVKGKVRRSGTITDGYSQVVVLDSETIRNSGASDLRQLLVRRGLQR